MWVTLGEPSLRINEHDVVAPAVQQVDRREIYVSSVWISREDNNFKEWYNSYSHEVSFTVLLMQYLEYEKICVYATLIIYALWMQFTSAIHLPIFSETNWKEDALLSLLPTFNAISSKELMIWNGPDTTCLYKQIKEAEISM